VVGVKVTVRAEEIKRVLRRTQQALEPGPLLEAVGERLLAWVSENFRRRGIEKPWPPLKPSTVAGRRKRKGSGVSQPLQATGRLAQSFTYEIAGRAVKVGTRDVRALWHHYGTSPYEITVKPSGRPARRNARRKGALHFVGSAGRDVFRREVRHPGLPARPLVPSPALARRLAEEALAAYTKKKVRDAAG
jgi:phage gpG-like protein